MLELLILAVIVAVVVLSLRPRKPVLEEPLIVEQPGRYHITLAPRLSDARAYIENVAERFAATSTPGSDTPTLFYQVHPAQLPREQGAYLLAVALRGGVLYFQAITPQSPQLDEAAQLKQLREYSAVVLAYHQLTGSVDEEALVRLRRTVVDAASQVGFEVKMLQ
ncbi:MAG TPA: hypothetical protein VFK88_04050 [Gallionella sp.]|nr:hypothetical protein [Gallionella sp.]